MLRQAWRLIIFVVGMTVLLIGIALIVLPGPAFVVIPVGLAILATEFAWARRWLQILRKSAEKAAEKLNPR
jgi:tellurite resistance protein TerC